DRGGSIEAARRAAEMLMVLAPNDSRSYLYRGLIEEIGGDSATAAADKRREYELNPNDTTILFFLSWTEASAGNAGRAKELAAQALRMSPKDRWVGMAHLTCAMCAFVQQDFPVSESLRSWRSRAIRLHRSAAC